MLEWVHTNYGLKITTMLENVLWFLDSPKQLISLEDQGRDSDGLLAGLWAPMQALGCLSQPAVLTSGGPETCLC